MGCKQGVLDAILYPIGCNLKRQCAKIARCFFVQILRRKLNNWATIRKIRIVRLYVKGRVQIVPLLEMLCNLRRKHNIG